MSRTNGSRPRASGQRHTSAPRVLVYRQQRPRAPQPQRNVNELEPRYRLSRNCLNPHNLSCRGSHRGLQLMTINPNALKEEQQQHHRQLSLRRRAHDGAWRRRLISRHRYQPHHTTTTLHRDRSNGDDSHLCTWHRLSDIVRWFGHCFDTALASTPRTLEDGAACIGPRAACISTWCSSCFDRRTPTPIHSPPIEEPRQCFCSLKAQCCSWLVRVH